MQKVIGIVYLPIYANDNCQLVLLNDPSIPHSLITGIDFARQFKLSVF